MTDIASRPKHSKLGASMAKRFFNCPGCVNMCKNAPKREASTFANLGTAAHELGEMCLTQNKNAIDFTGQVISVTINKNKSENFIVDEDMTDAVQIYVDEVRRILDETAGGELFIERKFDLSGLHKDLYGTNDACILQPYGTLYVLDYKHGQGLAVDVEDNEQLQYYAVGAARTFNFEFTNIELTIVQPRASRGDGIKKWTITREKLLEFQDKLLEKALATEAEDAPLVAGSHCHDTWCPAAQSLTCPELPKATKRTALATFKDSTVTFVEPQHLTDEQLGEALAFAPIFAKQFNLIKEYALARALDGHVPTGTKLVQKKGNRVWKDVGLAEKELNELLGDEIYKLKEMKSLAQIEKIKGVDKKEFTKYWMKPDNGFGLVDESDKRPSCDPKDKALSLFSDTTK